MNPTIINDIFGIFVVILQIVSIGLLVGLFIKKEPKCFNFIKKHSLLLAFLGSLGAMTGSLIYSEILKYEPCTLCWYQRILMYPQVFMILIAFTKKFSHEIWYYIRGLSIIGAIISFYHFVIKMTGSSPFPCSAFSVNGSDCVKQLVVEFGYINIPMMSFTIFIFLIILSFYATKK